MVNFNIAEMKGVIPAMITSFHNNEELNEQGLREVGKNQKSNVFKEMIHYLLFLTQTYYARLKLVHNLYRNISFKNIL